MTKIKLIAIGKKLSRVEMKNIFGGIDDGVSVDPGREGGVGTDCVHPPCTPDCTTPAHPNSYCATTFCTRRDGTSTTFQSCQFYN
jgi:hypothetical protein